MKPVIRDIIEEIPATSHTVTVYECPRCGEQAQNVRYYCYHVIQQHLMPTTRMIGEVEVLYLEDEGDHEMWMNFWRDSAMVAGTWNGPGWYAQIHTGDESNREYKSELLTLAEHIKVLQSHIEEAARLQTEKPA